MTRISRCFHTLEKMEEVGLPLLVHGESTDPAIDVFDREQAFIEETLGPTLERRDWTVPESVKFGNDMVVPLRAGETIPWKLV